MNHSEWNFYMDGDSDNVDIGATPSVDLYAQFVNDLNAGLPYGAHIPARPAPGAVLVPSALVPVLPLADRVEATVAALPPSERAEVAEYLRNVWAQEAHGMIQGGSTDAVLANIGAVRQAVKPSQIRTLDDFADWVDYDNAQKSGMQGLIDWAHDNSMYWQQPENRDRARNRILLGATPSPDTYPVAERPEWLKPFTHITGRISSAPTDLAQRMDVAVQTLRSAGWTPVIRSIGTDFSGPFGIPMPKDQPVDMLIHRYDRPYSMSEAQDAVGLSLLSASGKSFSVTGSWLSDFIGAIVMPPKAPRAPITADSRPTYDSWGPDNAWSCTEWVDWHKAVTTKYGATVADDRFVAAWKDGLSRFAGGKGTAPGSGAVFDAVPLDCRTINDSFRSYVSARPNLYAAVFSGVTGSVMAVANAAQDVTKRTANIISNNPGLSIGVLVAAGLVGLAGYAYVSTAPARALAKRR